MKKVLFCTKELREIPAGFHDNFECKTDTMTDFEYYALSRVAESLRGPGASSPICCDNNFWWDEDKGHRMSVFFTKEESVMFKDWYTSQLFRVEFE